VDIRDDEELVGPWPNFEGARTETPPVVARHDQPRRLGPAVSRQALLATRPRVVMPRWSGRRPDLGRVDEARQRSAWRQPHSQKPGPMTKAHVTRLGCPMSPPSGPPGG